MHALGELSGIGRSPDLLITPFSRAEAVASSKIEGTVTSASDLLKLELTADVSNASSDTREVHNYNRALKIGLQRISELPLSKRLLNELHSILLDGVRRGLLGSRSSHCPRGTSENSKLDWRANNTECKICSTSATFGT